MKRVVIIGAGFGGLAAAQALSRAPVEVTIIDRRNHHCFQPLLYQVATAALSPADIAWPIRAVLSRQRNARVLLAGVEAIDTGKKTVKTDSVLAAYDYLVLATGARHFYFGHEGWERFAPGLKDINDANRIRDRVLLAFERAELSDDATRQQKLMTFVIVGGGATGIEMAGAIAEMARQTLRGDFRRIDTRQSRIILLEAGPRILPSFPEKLSRYAEESLKRMGVEVRTSARVTGCDARGVATTEGRINASSVIWAAGVMASPASRWLGAPQDGNGRIIVNPDLSVPGFANVFAIGDTASVKDSTGAQIPGMAPAAKQMGRYVGRVIARDAMGKPNPSPFKYRHFGELATVGRRSAIVKLGTMELTGLAGWLFWSMAHIYFLIGVRNRFIVAFTWLWNYLTYERGARLIGFEDEDMKLPNA